MKNKFTNLLRWSEQYTQTDMLYLASSGFWSTVGQIVTFLFSFLLVWAFAHFLSKETYGTYKFVLSIFALLSITTLPGMRIAITRAVARGESGTIHTLTNLRSLFGLIGSFGSLVISAYYYLNSNTELATLFLIAAIFVPLYNSYDGYEVYLQGYKNFRLKAFFQIAQRAFVSIATIAVIFLSDNIHVVTAAYFTTFTFITYILYRNSLRAHPSNTAVDPDAKKLGFHLTGMSILTVGVAHIDKVLLFHFVGPAQLAIYFFALSLPQEIRGLIAQVTNIALPKFATNHGKEAARTLWRKLSILLLLLIAPVLGYILVAPYLFQFFFPQYIESVFYSQILILFTFFIPVELIQSFITARGDIRSIHVATISSSIVFIIVLLLLLPTYGIIGAIVAMLAQQIVRSLVLTYKLATMSTK
ncbi:MAG: oligosaccharide flippase family protein [Candidatus Paceibacterota bacterium]